MKSLLVKFTSNCLKTLIFSSSTQVLDIIEALVKAQGWSHCRLDGQTEQKQRTQQIDKFNNRAEVYIFLIR